MYVFDLFVKAEPAFAGGDESYFCPHLSTFALPLNEPAFGKDAFSGCSE
jgi:hypothetical protein